MVNNSLQKSHKIHIESPNTYFFIEHYQVLKCEVVCLGVKMFVN